MADLPVQLPSHDVGPTMSAAEAEDTYLNNGQAIVLSILPAQRVLTVRSPLAGLPDFTRTYSAGVNLLPRFEPIRWNDTTGRVRFSWDDPSGITHAAFLPEVIDATDAEKAVGGLYR